MSIGTMAIELRVFKKKKKKWTKWEKTFLGTFGALLLRFIYIASHLYMRPTLYGILQCIAVCFYIYNML